MQELLLTVLVLAFVVYRITRFLIKDTLIDGQRQWVHSKILGVNPKAWRDKLYELIDCPYCLSVWIAAGTVAATDAFTSVPLPVLAWLSTCGATMVLWHIIEVEHKSA
jgi:hypothetical protein